ncbi:MAG: hypothetical protein E7555_02865 [Ruminococcaceae bacterium]|nr:hypothetical protein [Oscillospiraceae bacterium]
MKDKKFPVMQILVVILSVAIICVGAFLIKLVSDPPKEAETLINNSTTSLEYNSVTEGTQTIVNEAVVENESHESAFFTTDNTQTTEHVSGKEHQNSNEEDWENTDSTKRKCSLCSQDANLFL